MLVMKATYMDFSKHLVRTYFTAEALYKIRSFALYEVHDERLYINNIKIISKECSIAIIVGSANSGKTTSIFYNMLRSTYKKYITNNDENLYILNKMSSIKNINLCYKHIDCNSLYKELLFLFSNEKNICVILDSISSNYVVTVRSLFKLESLLKENNSRLFISLNLPRGF